MTKKKKIRKHFNNSQRIIEAVIVISLAVVGVKLLNSSHAQSPYATVETENGKLSYSALVQTDSNASGGSYVKFGNDLSVNISNGQLTDSKGNPMRLLGVNADGTESGCVNWGGIVTQGAPLTQKSANAIASWKINAVRVPLNEDCWLGINGVTINGLNSADSAQLYQVSIKNWVTYLNNAGIIVILDLHWTAPGTILSTTQYPMADEDHSPTFWNQVATTFKSNTGVFYDVFNEPFIGHSTATTDIPAWACWLNGCNTTFTETDSNNVVVATVPYVTAGVQQIVTTIRDTGSTQVILLGGPGWSGDPCGIVNRYGSAISGCLQLSYMPIDPLNKLIVDYHNYYDPKICTTDSCWTTHWNNEISPITAAKIPVVTDEFGENDCKSSFMTLYMNWADQNNQSYMAWTWGTYGKSAPQPPACYLPPSKYAWVNFGLLDDYSGTPSSIIPQGPNYKSHLAQVSPY